MNSNGSIAAHRDLARQLLAHETSQNGGAAVRENNARHPIIERLLPSLVPLVGKTGSRSLLSRALTLAKRESPALRGVKVTAECGLNGLPSDAEGEVEVLTAHLIGLLITFMGATLTLRLLRNAWPELPALQNGQLEQTKHE